MSFPRNSNQNQGILKSLSLFLAPALNLLQRKAIDLWLVPPHRRELLATELRVTVEVPKSKNKRPNNNTTSIHVVFQ